MPHRDPETGQFVADRMDQFDDIEVATFAANAGVPASALSGGTGFGGGDVDEFEGLEVLDYDDIVDRNEELRLLWASHRLTVYINSTETADGTVTVSAEVSADPSLSEVTNQASSQSSQDIEGDVDGNAAFDDTIDIIGPVLTGTGHAPFSDGSTGVGGAGADADDRYLIESFPAEYGRFHPRDELFVNGQFNVWNVDDAGVHLTVSGQHVYGVLSD